MEDLHTGFPTLEGLLLATNGVSFTLDRGATLALVGESGSGKSMTCRSIIGLVPRPGEVIEGRVVFNGRNLLKLSSAELRKVRGSEIGMVFQDPTASLNPVYKVGNQIVEVLKIKRGMGAREATRRAIELLDRVGIASPETQFHSYPHEMSGGMRQRAMIAGAIATEPALLIADEPTAALDVTVQAQIMALLSELQQDTGMAMILVSHDFGVIAQHCDHVAVMYAGYMVEQAPVQEIFDHPSHPYTQALLASIPHLDPVNRSLIVPVKGQPPELSRLPSGCPFSPRCGFVRDGCDSIPMSLQAVGADHVTACPFVTWRDREAGAPDRGDAPP